MNRARDTRADVCTSQPSSYRFGQFELLRVQRSLRAGQRDVAVTPRAFDLLLALVERAGRLVTKNELLELVWPNLVVEENSLQVQISALRKLLGRRAIVTVPGRGYQFTLLPADAPLRFAQAAPPDTVGAQEEAERAIGNLPAQLAPLYGRVEDTLALARMIEFHAVVSVVGPGGIGKTRLAQAVAHALRKDYLDGVWIAELAPLTAGDQVVPTVARLLGLASTPKDTALDSLVDAIRHRHLLLVLDNCEHLIAAVCELAAHIARGTSRVHVLVTSQESLRMPDERIHRLDALAVPAADDHASALEYGAVELFVARAQAADPRFVLSADNVGAIVEICTRLDGMPLAVELAAARLPLLGVHGVRQRLDERFKLLVGGGERTALPRHHTLRAILEWSYALLESEERKVLDRLGVFVGSFCLEAAQRVASDDVIDAWAVIDHLAALVDKSWVLVDGGPVLRYRMLDSSRAFALERLAEKGVIEAARRRHAQAIADVLVADDMIETSGARIQRIGPEPGQRACRGGLGDRPGWRCRDRDCPGRRNPSPLGSSGLQRGGRLAA
jgi:predicted ATPase